MIHNQYATPHTDGTPMFMTGADTSRKLITAGYLQGLWGMRLAQLPALCYVDFLASRQERPCCWVAVISRSYSYRELMGLGGIYLKRRTWLTLTRLALVPLSIDWRGAYLVWDLTDGLYCQNVANIPDYRAVAFDPRGAAHDTEPAVLVRWLERIG